ncbi:hypothetical protein N9N67_01395 [Bacteriovoracaceae bacterium]|nr:hypothetical protein [Bacteriovoracaceae bacterium]
MPSINISLILLFTSLIFFACNNQTFSVGECVQRPDDVSAYRIEKINGGKYELLHLGTQETELFDSLNGFLKSSC